MEENNLQELHVSLMKGFRRLSSSEARKKFIKRHVLRMLSNESFFDFFRKRITIYKQYKKDKRIKKLVSRVISSASPQAVSKIILNSSPEDSKTLFWILVHSYLQWKEGFSLDDFSPRKYHNSKIKLVNELKNLVKTQHYRVALSIWGSFLMRRKELSLFSDIDCVIVFDDDKILKDRSLVNFLEKTFKRLNVVHYNLPDEREVEWFKNSEGIARCGFIKDGVFVNFKIITKKALIDSVVSVKQSLKEANQGILRLKGFDKDYGCFYARNSIPVYPLIKKDSEYKVYRGLIPEFLHTERVLVATDRKLEKEVNEIQRSCISLSLALFKAYDSSAKNLPCELLKMSYTPFNEVNEGEKKRLMRLYGNILKSLEPGVYLKAFTHRVYGEVVLPLMESIPDHWSRGNLLAFFLGCPGKTSSGKKRKVKKAFTEYYKSIKKIKDSINKEYVSNLVKAIIQDESVLLFPKTHKERVLLATALTDIIEPFSKRPYFYDIVEDLFKELFSREYEKAFQKISKIRRRDIERITSEMREYLKEATGKEYEVRYRVRQPAGLYQHHLMKNIPLMEVDDIVSILVEYDDRREMKRLIRIVDEFLKRRFKHVKRKTLRVAKYKGCHFYFKHKRVPFEVIIRDLDSNTSIEHKIEHSINQKKHHRFKLKTGLKREVLSKIG